MNFRTKDLMVTVLPKDAVTDVNLQLCGHLSYFCWHRCSYLPTCFGCSFQVTDVPTLCKHGTIDFGPINCTGTIRCAGSMTPEIERGPRLEDIGPLREQLKAHLVELDKIEAELKRAPGALAEVETLEAHLKDALVQVQARKAEIKGAKK